MTDRSDGVVWRAALEQLPPDSRGFHRTLRLHAVAFQKAQPAPEAVCGYQHHPGELRPNRDWATVTASGRCALCDLRLRRAAEAGIEVVGSVDLTDSDAQPERPRLSVVAAADDQAPQPDRRSPERP